MAEPESVPRTHADEETKTAAQGTAVAIERNSTTTAWALSRWAIRIALVGFTYRVVPAKMRGLAITSAAIMAMPLHYYVERLSQVVDKVYFIFVTATFVLPLMLTLATPLNFFAMIAEPASLQRMRWFEECRNIVLPCVVIVIVLLIVNRATANFCEDAWREGREIDTAHIVEVAKWCAGGRYWRGFLFLMAMLVCALVVPVYIAVMSSFKKDSYQQDSYEWCVLGACLVVPPMQMLVVLWDLPEVSPKEAVHRIKTVHLLAALAVAVKQYVRTIELLGEDAAFRALSLAITCFLGCGTCCALAHLACYCFLELLVLITGFGSKHAPLHLKRIVQHLQRFITSITIVTSFVFILVLVQESGEGSDRTYESMTDTTTALDILEERTHDNNGTCYPGGPTGHDCYSVCAGRWGNGNVDISQLAIMAKLAYAKLEDPDYVGRWFNRRQQMDVRDNESSTYAEASRIGKGGKGSNSGKSGVSAQWKKARRWAFAAGTNDWEVSSGQNSSVWVSFLDFYSRKRNLTVIAVRGTSARAMDVISDMSIFGGAAMLTISRYIVPGLGFWPLGFFEFFLQEQSLLMRRMVPKRKSQRASYYHPVVDYALQTLMKRRSNIIFVGHSLGGAVAKIAGSLTASVADTLNINVETVAISAPGVIDIRRQFVYYVSKPLERELAALGAKADRYPRQATLRRTVTNVFFEGDLVPKCGTRKEGAVHELYCANSVQCHSLSDTLQELWTKCRRGTSQAPVSKFSMKYLLGIRGGFS